MMLLATTFCFSQKVTVSGYITDLKTGERLTGATVMCVEDKSYAITNGFGFYTIKLNVGSDSINLQASFVGYEPIIVKVLPNENSTFNIALKSFNILEEVTVRGTRSLMYDKGKEMSIISIPMSKVTVLPSLGGESDLLKIIQLMPGVQSGNEASSGLYVRGGSPDQNLMVIDDVPVYYVNHLGGFVSTFNTDAINSMKLIKGGFPARYGSRLSSILDVRMKEGNLKEQQGNFMIGMIASKFMVEGPLKKDTSSYMISVRRLMYDLLTRPITFLTSGNESIGYTFYDFNAKVNHIVSHNDRLYLSIYSGDDKVTTSYRTNSDINRMKLHWGNILGSLRWNHIFSNSLFSNVTLYSTRYRLNNEFSYKVNMGDTKEKTTLGYLSSITDVAGKIDMEYNTGGFYKLRFGGTAIYHFFNPSRVVFSPFGQESANDDEFGSQKQKGFETGLYLENEITIGRFFYSNIGLRLSNYSISGMDYNSLEPRILTSLRISDDFNIKASYATMNQYVHLLTGSGPSMQSDIWVPVTENIYPSLSRQYAIGLDKSFGSETYEVSLEGYYKRMDRLITYKEGVSMLSSSKDWQYQVETNGLGEAYGLEFLLQKTKGTVTGWFAYTYSKSTRQFENLNSGKPFPFKYDRRHDISIVYLQKLRSNIQFSATWVYGTGNPFTLPLGKYKMITEIDDDLNAPFPPDEYGQYYDEINSSRMRDYHKLDIGLNFYKSIRIGERTLSFNVYNLYNRQNPYFYFLHTTSQPDINGNEIPGTRKTVMKQQSYFPIIPSISYSVKF